MILITGATGFLGMHLQKALKKEHKIEYKTLKCRMADREGLVRETKGIDTVIHLAGNLRNDFEMNPVGARNLIEACRINKVKKIIYLSSIDAAFSNDYGRSKLAAERCIIDSGISFAILRPSLVYGEGDKKHLTRIRRMMRISPIIPILGDGRYLRQPVHVGDVITAIIRVLGMNALGSGKMGRVYNIVGEKLSWNEIIDTINTTFRVRRLKVHIPLWLGKAAMLLGFSQDNIRSLTFDKIADRSDMKELGIIPQRFKDKVWSIA